jgi:hypothetical protein
MAYLVEIRCNPQSDHQEGHKPGENRTIAHSYFGENPNYCLLPSHMFRCEVEASLRSCNVLITFHPGSGIHLPPNFLAKANA